MSIPSPRLRIWLSASATSSAPTPSRSELHGRGERALALELAAQPARLVGEALGEQRGHVDPRRVVVGDVCGRHFLAFLVGVS